MHQDDIKQEKESEALIKSVTIYYEDIGIEFGIEKNAMLNNENWELTNDRRCRTTKSSQNQNARKKGKLQIFGHIESGQNLRCGDERKNKKNITSGERENYRKPNYIAGISPKE